VGYTKGKRTNKCKGEQKMDIKRNAHLAAASDLLEVMSLTGCFALIADCIWVMRDIVADGVTLGRVVVAVMLFIACFVLMTATAKFHRRSVKAKISETLQVELKNVRIKHKRKNKSKGK
jgi:hypothetical protein